MLKEKQRYKLQYKLAYMKNFDVEHTSNYTDVERCIARVNRAGIKGRAYVYDFKFRQKWYYDGRTWYTTLFGRSNWVENNYLKKI